MASAESRRSNASLRHTFYLTSAFRYSPADDAPTQDHAQPPCAVDATAQNQCAAPSLSANPATRIANPAAGYASSSLAAKPSGSASPKAAANPPTNLRLTGWEKAKPAAPEQPSAAVQNDGTSQYGNGKSGVHLLSGGRILLPSRAETPPPTEPVESYEISPFKEESSDEEEDENESEAKKPIPAWARKENLGPALRRQVGTDPDEVFRT